MPSRTGNFSIGFRRGGSKWQRDLPALAAWAKSVGFEAIDLGNGNEADIATLRESGLKLGSVDIIDWPGVTSPDEGKRRDAIAKEIEHIKKSAALGAVVFFTVAIGHPSRSRLENYRAAVDGYAPLAEAAASAGASIAFEGWPGGHDLPNPLSTPEQVRQFLKDVPRGAGLNYDPSHLIRIGVDHLRFLREFLPHVKHVHGKDVILFADDLYEFGHAQRTFSKGHGWGGETWRYSLPGHGESHWPEIYRILEGGGFKGIISVELEDEHYNGKEDGEKVGLEASLNFLRTI